MWCLLLSLKRFVLSVWLNKWNKGIKEGIKFNTLCRPVRWHRSPPPPSNTESALLLPLMFALITESKIDKMLNVSYSIHPKIKWSLLLSLNYLFRDKYVVRNKNSKSRIWVFCFIYFYKKLYTNYIYNNKANNVIIAYQFLNSFQFY